ncbi:lysoplasmalogenase [Streptomyces tropicalis]|uniref:Lysoplasmalogenase n=1 Tax=Streptomyces tropicalis TaxID=3034234 RepID=A0ABT6A621_9ACTN|nr:lysoplasmalogenase [Streptomyces tropicalis]MDF3299270.1 lysoplasmalogenase [Streptomyces tropicalis]
MPPVLLAFALAVLADLTAVALHLPLLEDVSKPLLVPLLALHMMRAGGGARPVVLAGLALATAGDVALLLPGTAAFLAGTACFLGFQLAYVAAFAREGALAHLRRRPWLYAGALAVWAAANAALAPGLGSLAWAVAPYSLALVTMAVTAPVLGTAAAWGGAVFVASDLLVGLGVAGVEFTGRRVLVTATYAAAQFLLARAWAAAPPESGPARPQPAVRAPSPAVGNP